MNEDAMASEWLRAVFAESLAESAKKNALASALYNMLIEAGEMHSPRVRSLTYRCANQGCALLDVFDVPGIGIAVGFPRYKTSPEETERSSTASGRAKNTEDGDHRWKRHAAFMESDNLLLSCDHLKLVVLSDARLQSDWAAGHTEVRVRRDGTLYAVC